MWWRRLGIVLVSVLSVLGVLSIRQTRAEALILINEVLADPPAIGGDANGDGIVSATQDEFVELVNTAAAPVSLAGWSFADLVSTRHTFAPSSTIPAFGFFVIFGGGAPQGFANAAIASSGTLSLNNTGDTLTLRDQASQLVETFVYGAEGGMDVSLTRFPDALGPFVKHTTVSVRPFSPGQGVDSRSTLPLPSSDPVFPEPSSLLLLGSGMFRLSLLRRRRTL